MTMLLALSLLALGLTVAMFATRNMMLGFPSAIFWGIMGGYAYQQSSTTWDWQYTLFFASMGMVIFCLFAAYALRNRDLAGPDADKGLFIDEVRSRMSRSSPKKRTGEGNPDKPPEGDWGDIDRLDAFALEDNSTNKRAQDIRKRAEKRKKKVKWGEFK